MLQSLKLAPFGSVPDRAGDRPEFTPLPLQKEKIEAALDVDFSLTCRPTAVIHNKLFFRSKLHVVVFGATFLPGSRKATSYHPHIYGDRRAAERIRDVVLEYLQRDT